MPRINKIDLTQINLQIDKLDNMTKEIGELKKKLTTTNFQVSQLDYIHAKPTTNNLVFQWTGTGGGAGTISWVQGFIQDKNAVSSQVIGSNFSSAKGSLHTYPVPAGTLTAQPASSYLWLGWNYEAQQMVADPDAGVLFQGIQMLVVCQLFTGTAAAGLETIGGGGSQGGVDLSGGRYKLV